MVKTGVSNAGAMDLNPGQGYLSIIFYSSFFLTPKFYHNICSCFFNLYTPIFFKGIFFSFVLLATLHSIQDISSPTRD